MAKLVAKSELFQLIGKELDVGDWFTIDQERINEFADVTLDHQFIHIDPDKAKDTPFGSTIAHGFLTLSMLTHLCENVAPVPEEVVMGINYGFDKIRFLTPVKVNQRIRARVKLLDVTAKEGGQLLLKQGVDVEIEGEAKPAVVCEWLALYICQ